MCYFKFKITNILTKPLYQTHAPAMCLRENISHFNSPFKLWKLSRCLPYSDCLKIEYVAWMLPKLKLNRVFRSDIICKSSCDFSVLCTLYLFNLRQWLHLTVRLAVGHPGPGGVVVVRVPLRVQVIKENIHLIWRQERRRGLHVVVAQARVVGVRVLSVQHGVVMHPAGLISRHIHLCGSSCKRAYAGPVNYPGKIWKYLSLYEICTVSIYSRWLSVLFLIFIVCSSSDFKPPLLFSRRASVTLEKKNLQASKHHMLIF